MLLMSELQLSEPHWLPAMYVKGHLNRSEYGKTQQKLQVAPIYEGR